MADNTHKHEIAGVFDRAAPTYDEIGPAFFSSFGRRLVEVVELVPGEAVLDVACGRGAVLFPASDAVGPGGRVIGIDIAPTMVAATQARMATQGVTNVLLQQMDAETLEFGDARFDGVLCGFALFFFPQMEQALAEMRRVVKPGGRIAVSTWMSPFGPEFNWLDPLMQQFAPPQQAPARSLGEQAPVFDTPEGLTAILAHAGLTQITITCETQRFVYANEAEWWASLWSHGMRGWLEQLQQRGDDELERFKQAVFAELTARRQPGGLYQTSSALLAVATRP